MGCMVGNATVKPERIIQNDPNVRNEINKKPKQNKIFNHSSTKIKMAERILQELEDKNVQEDDQIDLEKQVQLKKKVQEFLTYEQKKEFLFKQHLKLKYPPNSEIKTDVKHQLPDSNLQSKYYLRDVKEELLFIESRRVGIVQMGDEFYDGYCNKQRRDGFGMIVDGTTHKIGSFFEGVQMYGQGLYTNELIYQLGKFRDFRLQGYGVYKFFKNKNLKIFKGEFQQDKLDQNVPNYLVKQFKLQKYFGYTDDNRIDNFGLLIEKNQLRQFVYNQQHKQYKISNLKSLFQTSAHIDLFKGWSRKMRNLIDFILSISEMTEENKCDQNLQELRKDLDSFEINIQDIKFKRKKYIISAEWEQITMFQFIDTGSLQLGGQELSIFIIISNEKFSEFIISKSMKINKDNTYELYDFTIKVKQDEYVQFGSYSGNLQYGVFKQYSLKTSQLELADILDGKKWTVQPIQETLQYFKGKLIRDDESSLEFNLSQNDKIVYDLFQNGKYENIEKPFKSMIEKIFQVVKLCKTYQQEDIYYKGQWKYGMFEGIGIKYNNETNQYNLGIFKNNKQSEQGFYIENDDQQLIVEFCLFSDDLRTDLCKIHQLSKEEMILFINKENGIKQKEGLMKVDEDRMFTIHFKDDIHFYKQQDSVYVPCEHYQQKNDTSQSIKPFKDDDDKKLQQVYKEFMDILCKEEKLLNDTFFYENYEIYQLFGKKMQGEFIEDFENLNFGRSIFQHYTIQFRMGFLQKYSFELYYEGTFYRYKQRGFGKKVIYNEGFELQIGIFDEAKNLNDIFIKIRLNEDAKTLKYQILDQYLYNIPKINKKHIKTQYLAKFNFTKLDFFILKHEIEFRMAKTKPIIRRVDNDLIFLKTLTLNKVFQQNNVQQQGELELNDLVTGSVIINNEQEDTFSFGYVYQNKLMNTYLHLTSTKILQKQDEKIYKQIKAKTSLIYNVEDQFTMKERKYPHKQKFLLKKRDDQNEFGATFHENGFCQYYQQINKIKVYPSNGQVNYNYRKIMIQQEQDLYDVIAEKNEFQLSLQEWINEITDNNIPIVPVILKPEKQYYQHSKKQKISRKFWNATKSQHSERIQNMILIRMIANQVESTILKKGKQTQTNVFKIHFNGKQQLVYQLKEQKQLDKNNDQFNLKVIPLYQSNLGSFNIQNDQQMKNFKEYIYKDKRLQRYIDKILEEIKIELDSILFDHTKKVYLYINKPEQKTLIINEDYLYYGQYDDAYPNGYGFAYFVKENYKYKGQWNKGLKDGWGYMTYFLGRDFRNKLAKEKQFDRFNQDQAENLPDLSIFQQVKFPLVELSSYQTEFVTNCKNIYNQKIYQLNIDSNNFNMLLSIRNQMDEISFMQNYENNCFKEFKYIAFKNRLAGSIYLGSWSKQNMHGYGKIVYQSENLYSGYFKNGQRDYRGLYLRNIKKNFDEISLYLGFWKDDKQDSNYYQQKNLNKQSLLGNMKEVYIGEFKQDQQDGEAQIYDYKELIKSPESNPKSKIKQIFNIQIDVNNFELFDMVYIKDSTLSQQTPEISNKVIELMEARFKLTISKKQIIQKVGTKTQVGEGIFSYPLYFQIELFGQVIYYKGQWKNSKPNGEGHALNLNTFVQGTFKDGQLTEGYYVCEDYQYFGGWADEKMNGKGEYYNNTIYYQGYFKMGIFHGKEGKMKFLDASVQEITSGEWENGKHIKKGIENNQKIDSNQQNAFSYGTAIEFTQVFNQELVEVAKRYNCEIQNQIKGVKYVQSQNFYFGEVQNQSKEGQGISFTKDKILYSGKFSNDQFLEGIIVFVDENLVQIINRDGNQCKMVEYRLNDQDYKFYGSCRIDQSKGIYQKIEGSLINGQQRFFGSFKSNQKEQGKLVFDYGCIIDLSYDESEKIKEVKKIQYQITPFMRKIMNKFNLYQINEIENPEYAFIKFDQDDYFSIQNNSNDRILFNKDKIIYQYVSDGQAYYMREYNLQLNTFYLGGVSKDQKSADQAIFYDQSNDELYFGAFDEGKREGKGRLIKQSQIIEGFYKQNEFKFGKVVNSDGSYFKIFEDKTKMNQPMIYHLGNLQQRWQDIDDKLQKLKKKLIKQDNYHYSNYILQHGKESAIKIFEEMEERWSECKTEIQEMNKEGCKLIIGESRIVSIKKEHKCLLILKNYAITHYLKQIDSLYFGVSYTGEKNQIIFGYFDQNLRTKSDAIIFYSDGSISFSKFYNTSDIDFIRYFKHEPNEELNSFSKQLGFIRTKINGTVLANQFEQTKSKIIDYQIQDVVNDNDSNFYRVIFSDMYYKGNMDSNGEPNGYGEAHRRGYYFKGYRQNGSRRFGEVYEEGDCLYYGELDGKFNGLGIKIGQGYYYVGYFANDSFKGKGELTKNGVIIEATFEDNRIKSDIAIKFDAETFRPQILYKKLGIVNQDIKFDPFNKEIKLIDQDIHRIYNNKGDIIFENGDYQSGTFDQGILIDGLYYNRKEDKIYVGKFELGYLNGDQGFSFDGKILIQGGFNYGIMNGRQEITWYDEKMGQLSKLSAEFVNGNPLKDIEFIPKKWQSALMDNKGLKEPYSITADSRFIVFKLIDQQPYTKIYLDVFENELLLQDDSDRVLINYEDGNVAYLEIMNSNSFFYQIVMKEKNVNTTYSGPGFFNMKHSENKNKDNKYRYDKLWYTDSNYNEKGVKEIQFKYVFGQLVREKQKEVKQIEGDVQKQNPILEDKEYVKYEKADKSQLKVYEDKIKEYEERLQEILDEEIKQQEIKQQKLLDEKKQQEINPNLIEDIQQQIQEQKNMYQNIPLISIDDIDQIQQNS